jgi:hypothetical protein
MRRQHPRKLWKNTNGATIVEFAIVAPIFFLIILGIIEFGLYMFHRVTLEAIVMQAGREASLGRSSVAGGACSGTNDSVSYIQCYVRAKSAALFHGEEVTFNINRVAAGTVVPDICLDNPSNPSSRPATCTFYDNVNGIPDYQGASSNNVTGAAGELIEVRVNYPWRILIPFAGQYFGNRDAQGRNTGVALITTSTVIKNEPFNP